MDWLAILKTIAPKGKPEILSATASLMPAVVTEFDLTTDSRIAHFLAQLAHESDGFKTTVEYASGAAYEGRSDLGNVKPGDGKRFKGRGLIQLTGRANYAEAGRALGVDLVSRPEAAAAFPNALRIAGWYWKTRKINPLADAENVEAVTRKINGGTNGLADRTRYLSRARLALSRAKANELQPVALKSIATSKTANGSIIAGAGGAVAAGKEAIDVARQAADTASSGWDLVASAGPWVLLALVIVGVCAFIWWDRRQKLQLTGV